MRALLRIYRSHRSGRLFFVVLTLSIALAGAYANFSLSHRAISTFNSILAFGNQTQVLLSGRYADAVRITKSRVDASLLAQDMMASVRHAAPETGNVTSVSTFESIIETQTQSRPVTVYSFEGQLVESVGATVVEGRLSSLSQPDHCAIGQGLAESLDLGPGSSMVLSGVPCRVAAVVSVPERPPVSSMNAGVIVSADELSFTVSEPNTVSVLLNAPADQIDAALFKQRLGVGLDLSHLQIWSSDQIQVEAARLKRIVGTISNGLGLVILLVGTGSVVSLMSYSVSERRKEIAIRLTIGASKRNIAAQFVVETFAICVLALIFGVLLGVVLAQYLVAPLNNFMTVGDLDTSTNEIAPFIQTTIGFILVTLLAALGPAIQAAKTDPSSVFRSY